MNILKTMVLGGMMAGLFGAVPIAPAQAASHTSDAYLERQTVTIEGMVAQFTFRNPYSLVYVMAPNKSGTMVTWILQWRGASALSAEGIDRHTLAAGDHVVASGNPARDSRAHRMRLKAIERPADGWMWVGIKSD